MPALSSLTKPHPVEIVFEYEDESVTVVFDRNKITQDWTRKIKQSIDAQDGDPVASATAEILISWDVLDEAGQVLPPSVEILRRLPVAALVILSEKIGAASVPSSAEGEVSSAPSAEPQSASSPQAQMHQNGEQPSESPAPSALPSPT